MSEPTAIHPVAQAQIDSAKRKVTLEEKIDFLRDRRATIIGFQRRQLDSGLISRPDADEIRKVAVIDDIEADLVGGRRG